VEKIITAMPLVNPATTGYGMNLIIDPKRAKPIITIITPAMIVAMVRPSNPYFWTIP
jgi:hypothetical protein